MTNSEFRFKLKRRPQRKKQGEIAYCIPNRLVSTRHEIALSMFFATNRRLFGLAYFGLQPEYFDAMPPDSGVYIGVALPTKIFSDNASRPGDIDLLVIPYEHDELVVHRALAIEVKAVRATFVKQDRSPNEFGRTQALGLKTAGFPYVAIAHLIVSDSSPQDAWREMDVARVIDNNSNVKLLGPVLTDCLPMDLIDRSFGRLSKLSADQDIGLVAAYLSVPRANERSPSFWHPDVRAARPNPFASLVTIKKIAGFFDAHPEHFLDNPRFDPPIE